MFWVVKRKELIASFALLLTFIVFSVGTFFGGASPVFFGESTRKTPIYGVDTDKKVVALTFDAAWGADKTLGILDIMKEYNAVGTFFLVGFWLDKFPEETKKIAEAGFDIGNHSNNHLKMSGLNEQEIENEIAVVNKQVEKITGKTPKYFRPPYGDYNNRLIDTVSSLGLIPVQWSIDTLDWKGLSARQIADRVLPKAKSGDIILFHNNSENVLNALPIVLEGLKGLGFSFVKLSDMVLTKDFTTDSNGIQHAKGV